MNDVKRCISWVAVSSKPQYEKESPETQRQLNADVARELGAVIAFELVVPGESREYISFDEAARELEAYRQLRGIIAQRAADLIIFRDIDRLGRTASLCLQVASECLKGGIALYDRTAPPTSLDSGVQASDHGSIILTAIRSSFSQIEMLKLRQRHQDGMIGRVKQGKFPGKIPYGYRKVFDADGSVRIEIVPEQARVIRMVCLDMYCAGLSYAEIVRQLNVQGILNPSGKRWVVRSVTNIVEKIWRYAGVVELNVRGDRPYQRVHGDYPCILTDAEAKRVEDEYLDRKKYNQKAPRRLYRFSRACVCQVCGKYLKAETQNFVLANGEKAEYRRYVCRHHKPNSRITERKALGILLGLMTEMQATERMEVNFQSDSIVRVEEINTKIRNAESELNAITQRRNRLTRAYVDLGAISDDEYQLEMDNLSSRRKALGETLERLSEEATVQEDYASRVIRAQWLINSGKKILESNDVAKINQMVRNSFRIYVGPKGKFKIEFL